MYTVSFVIRAYNEKQKLEELITSIRQLQYPQDNIELIVVDNGSIDGTDTVATQLGAKVVHLAQKDFSYPKSLNIGCEIATGELLVFVSAHCLMWKAESLSKSVTHFDSQKVAGVYGPLIPRSPYTFTQWWTGWLKYYMALSIGRIVETKPHIGILGNTNSVIRRSLWDKHHFDENYGMGAEDYEWAEWALTSGYQIIKDPAFTVRHSHYLGLIGSIRQMFLWISMKKNPRKFNPEELHFRKDIQRSKKS